MEYVNEVREQSTWMEYVMEYVNRVREWSTSRTCCCSSSLSSRRRARRTGCAWRRAPSGACSASSRPRLPCRRRKTSWRTRCRWPWSSPPAGRTRTPRAVWAASRALASGFSALVHTTSGTLPGKRKANFSIFSLSRCNSNWAPPCVTDSRGAFASVVTATVTSAGVWAAARLSLYHFSAHKNWSGKQKCVVILFATLSRIEPGLPVAPPRVSMKRFIALNSNMADRRVSFVSLYI